jgi:SAM-dependent methyltransferase
MKEKEIKEVVRDRYGRIAKQDRESCSCSTCGGSPQAQAQAIGYSREDLTHVPEGAVMGLGCGNPAAIADLKVGEVVLDLGSGAGVDVFLAADKVGPRGRVIGVDMTEEMVEKARSIARDHGYHNVEFRLGEIENLPIGDQSVDAVISNCVINLAPDKSRVFREAWRVLKPGGRLTVSDIVSERALPAEMKSNVDAWACCIAGALEQQEYLTEIKEAGFEDVQVLSSKECHIEGEGGQLPTKLLSITVQAYR